MRSLRTNYILNLWLFYKLKYKLSASDSCRNLWHLIFDQSNTPYSREIRWSSIQYLCDTAQRYTSHYLSKNCNSFVITHIYLCVLFRRHTQTIAGLSALEANIQPKIWDKLCVFFASPYYFVKFKLYYIWYKYIQKMQFVNLYILSMFFHPLDEIINKYWPSILWLDIINILDLVWKVKHHVPWIFMDFWLFSQWF